MELNDFLGISYLLPGTGVESSLPLKISAVSLIIIVISPMLTIILFYLMYKRISSINPSELMDKLQLLPESDQNKIEETLKNINQKYFWDFRSE